MLFLRMCTKENMSREIFYVFIYFFTELVSINFQMIFLLCFRRGSMNLQKCEIKYTLKEVRCFIELKLSLLLRF